LELTRLEQIALLPEIAELSGSAGKMKMNGLKTFEGALLQFVLI